MGRIFERFGNIRFHNEAEVSNRFVVPLFTDFLGYIHTEILPERLQPAVTIPLNRDIRVDGNQAKIRPDFMVALEGEPERVVFSFESKGPNESLDDHLEQLIAYCIIVGNLVATTNGTEFRVYNAKDLIFSAENIAALDLQFSELRKLLHKEVAHIPLTERIRTLDDDKALGRSVVAIENEQRKKVAVQNSDFLSYLRTVADSLDLSSLPVSISKAFQIPLMHFPSQDLFTFLPLVSEANPEKIEPLSYSQVIQEIARSSILIVGESGIGKTSLLTEIAREFAEACLRNESELIPVIVRLAQYNGPNKIAELIANQLGRGHDGISSSEVDKLMHQGRLVLLFDAFDEVMDTHLQDLQREIETLLQDFRCKVVITTRHFRDPQLPLVTKYELQPLTPRKISAFARMYLGAQYQEFLNELERKDLANTASNTLLLTLLILLYRKDHNLPGSRTQVMHAVVNQLEKWARSKTERYQNIVPWQNRLDLLSELAFLSFTNGASYTLNIEQADHALLEKLDDWETHRIVPRGMLKSDAYAQLEDTGLIQKQDYGVSFWHRAFQEYLASLQAAKRILSAQIELDDLVTQPKWESILPSIAFLTENPGFLIRNLLALNVFISGRAIIECGLDRGMDYDRTVDCLKLKCKSGQRAIRQIAVNLLKQMRGDYIGRIFHELLESDYLKKDNEFEHIQKLALVEVARRKIPNAREIVYAHLNWQSYTNLDWINEETHAGAAVIEALSWFDDEESHGHIVDRWMTHIDIPTRDACRDAVIRIAKRGTLAVSAKRKLFEWFIEQRPTNISQTNAAIAKDRSEDQVDYWGLRSAFMAMHDLDLASKLVSALAVAEDQMQVSCMKDVLKSFSESQIIEALIQRSRLHKNDPVLAARFVEVLSEVEGDIPMDVFWEFAQMELPCAAKAYAIRRLGNLPFDQIESTVLAALCLPAHERLAELRNEYLIEQVLQAHTNIELIQILAEFARVPQLEDSARLYLNELLTRENNPLRLLRQLVGNDMPPDVRWSIITKSNNMRSKTLQKVLPEILNDGPDEYFLISDPCNYAEIQNEVFRVLGSHGKLALLAKPENQPIFLYNISSETLFQLIRRDKVYELEPLISSWVDKRIRFNHNDRRRMVIGAIWVLAVLGNIPKAQSVIDLTITNLNLSEHGSDWVLCDILEGIHLLPPEYALNQIEKIWSNRGATKSTLVPSHCVYALAQIGTKQALDILARIVDETLEQSDYLLLPEEALRAMQYVSPMGREQWLIQILQREPQDRFVIQRAIDMLGMIGNPQALPAIERYLMNHPKDRIGYFAFWAIHNIYKANNVVWYNSEEMGSRGPGFVLDDVATFDG